MPDRIFIFDVDGTLTPSRGEMDSEFREWFIEFAKNNRVALVTGSDLVKTLEQVGDEVVSVSEYCFNCSGNDVYHNGQSVYVNEWACPDSLVQYLHERLVQSDYTEKYGNHLEPRVGMLNFSVVGRGAVGEQRTKYYNWDVEHKERETIASAINDNWPDLQAVVGGETGIDIFAKGKDKSQVLNFIDKDVKIYFYGDRMDPVGNDYPLAKAIMTTNRGSAYQVENWQDTWEKLKTII